MKKTTSRHHVRFFSVRAYLFSLLFLSACVIGPVCLGADTKDSKGEGKTITVNAIDADRIIIETKSANTKEKEKPKESSDEESFGMDDVIKRCEGLWSQIKKRFDNFQLWRIVFLFFGIIGTLILSRFSRWFVSVYMLRFTQKTKTNLDELACEALGKPAALMIFGLGLYISTYPLLVKMPKALSMIYGDLCLALSAGAVAWGFYRLVEVVNHIMQKFAERTDNNIDDLIVSIVRKSLKVMIVIISILFIGQNILGMNITTLLAGAGVFGLAIAFAAQDTIANFFGSIMIVLDRPFSEGDRVNMGNADGTVEHVGFRSTRIRTLDGHVVTVPNKNVANETIVNISKRPYIKQLSNITLTYDTPPEKMELAMKILHEIYDGAEGMDMEEKPPVIVFNSFNDWSLNIMVILWYHPGDWTLFQKWNSEKNLEILRRFNAEGLEFAFPTNTTYLAYDEKRELKARIVKEKTS